MNSQYLLTLARNNPKRTALLAALLVLVGGAGLGVVMPTGDAPTTNTLDANTTTPTDTPTSTPTTTSTPTETTTTPSSVPASPPNSSGNLTDVNDTVSYVYPLDDDKYRVTIYVQTHYVCIHDGTSLDSDRRCQVDKQLEYKYLSFINFYSDHTGVSPPDIDNSTTTDTGK